MNPQQVFAKILDGDTPPFAMLYRPSAQGADMIEIMVGDASNVDTLADIPLDDEIARIDTPRHDVFVLVPHRQVAERGFETVQDETPLVVLKVHDQNQISRAEALGILPNDQIELANERFDIDNDTYAGIVRDVLQNEIATGEGANFVIKRSFVAEVTDYSIRTAMSLFHRLLRCETGAYWTFMVHTGERTLVGATPERHVSLADGRAVMNPISGTYRYPPEGADLSKILTFLEDRKETEELYMVLDEELKMMARICDGGGQVVGPCLREMAQLAHTEYYIEGNCTLDPREVLRETLLAPTVTGGPLENACRVIAQYEPKGRGYYGGVAALIGRDADGTRNMDSAILIRTADFTRDETAARMAVGVGATLVRHSDAQSEVAETHTKAAGVLKALKAPAPETSKTVATRLQASRHPKIQAALARRNDRISDFWLKGTDARSTPQPLLMGQKALVIDAQDNFTSMLGVQLDAIGLDADVQPFDGNFQLSKYDLVVLGPGPGDPRDADIPRISRLSSITSQLLSPMRIPFLSVCLSHQLLCRQLGLPIKRRPFPNQGTQKDIDLFGTERRVGFYNSFAAHSNSSTLECGNLGRVEVCRVPETGEVHALRGSHFASVQFHMESVLTEDGTQILSDLLTPLMTLKKALAS